MWLGMLVTVPTGNPEFAAVLKVVRARGLWLRYRSYRRGAFQTCISLPTTSITTRPPDSNPCTRVSHHNRAAIYQALQGGPLREPGHVDRPSSHTMPESSLRSFRANVIPRSGSTRAPSCSRTALVGARPGTDCTGPDSAFSHDAG